jgi:hypothetical protein
MWQRGIEILQKWVRLQESVQRQIRFRVRRLKTPEHAEICKPNQNFMTLLTGIGALRLESLRAELPMTGLTHRCRGPGACYFPTAAAH